MPTDIRKLPGPEEIYLETDKTQRVCNLAAGMYLAGNYIRLGILYVLFEHGKELTAGQIAKAINKPQGVVSNQLTELRESGLIKFRRDVVTHYYTLTDHPFLRVVWAALQELVNGHVVIGVAPKEVLLNAEPQAPTE